VLLLVVLHGSGIAIYLRWLARHTDPSPRQAVLAPPSAPARSMPAASSEAPIPERITIDELRALQASGQPVIVADVRTERSYRDHALIGVGAIRLPPDDAVRLARERRLDQHATLVLYCA